MRVIKRNKLAEDFDMNKILKAIGKSADRMSYKFTKKELKDITDFVAKSIIGLEVVNVEKLHSIVENALDKYCPVVAKSYKDYRNYKVEYGIYLMNDIEGQIRKTLEEVDRENSNSNTRYISTKRTEIAQTFSKEMYQKMYLSKDVLSAMKDGYIYVHDLKDMLLPQFNCLDENEMITIRTDGEVKRISLGELGNRLKLKDNEIKDVKDIEIESRNGFVELKKAVKRKRRNGEKVFKITTRGNALIGTEEHIIPVIDVDGKEVLKNMQDITKDDKLIIRKDSYFDCNDYIDLLQVADRNDINVTVYVPKNIQYYLLYKYNKSISEILMVSNKKFSYLGDYLKFDSYLFKKLLNKINIPFNILECVKISAKGSKVRLPLYVKKDHNFSRVIGYIFADGSVIESKKHSSYQIVFTNTNEKLIKNYIDSFYNVFGIKSTFIKPSGDNNVCYRSTCGSKLLVALFRDLDGDGSYFGYKNNEGDLRIPKFIVDGDINIKKCFLSSAIDSDGFISKKYDILGYASSNYNYTKQVFELVKTVFNINKDITIQHIDSKNTEYSINGVVGYRNYDMYRFNLNMNDIKIDDYLPSLKFNNYKYNNENNGCSKYEYQEIINIQEIEETDSYFYDLQTGDEYFIASDVLVHNCCLTDVKSILTGGFELEGIFYTEPKDIRTAVGQVGDIIMIISAQHFGRLNQII